MPSSNDTRPRVGSRRALCAGTLPEGGHMDFATALVVCALVSSIILALNRGDRLIPAIAFVACGIEALIAFHIIQLASPKFRIDVILPAILVITGGICWSKSSTKSTIT